MNPVDPLSRSPRTDTDYDRDRDAPAAGPRDAAAIPDVITPSHEQFYGRLARVDQPRVADARTATTQRTLDDVRARASGPYRVPGESGEVSAAPPFRMMPGYDNQRGADARLLRATSGRVPPAVAGRVLAGRGSADDVHAVTQALIDAGKLPSSGGTTEQRIRQMQFDHGVGFDCAGYVQQAHAALHGRAGLKTEPWNEDLRGLAGRTDARGQPAFERVARPSELRAGDLITLGDRNADGSDRHCLIVYEHHVASDAERAELLKHDPAAAANAFAASNDTVHVVQVDSSWGAGIDGTRNGDAQEGGLKRETWWYNERSKQWAHLERDHVVVDSSPHAGEPIDEMVRGKENVR